MKINPATYIPPSIPAQPSNVGQLWKFASKVFLEIGKTFINLKSSLKAHCIWLRKSMEQHPYFSTAMLVTLVAGMFLYRFYAHFSWIWWKFKANRNDLIAQLKYADICFYGRGKNQDFSEARTYFERAASQNSSEGQFYLGLMYLRGLGGDRNETKALTLFEAASIQGNSRAQYYYANILEPQNPTLARNLYRQAAAQNHILAKRAYADMCKNGQGGNVDLKEARIHYQQVADYGFTDDMLLYAEMCKKGEGGARNLAKAESYEKRASTTKQVNPAVKSAERVPMLQKVAHTQPILREEEGMAEALTTHAKRCFYGMGSTENDYEARIYFEKAAHQNSEAQYYLGLMSYLGLGGDQDLAKAQEYFEQASKRGNMRAQYEYARMCIDNNPKLARSLFRQAAAKGYIPALGAYADVCKKGKGGAIDLQEARIHFQLMIDYGFDEVETLYHEMCEQSLRQGLNIEVSHNYAWQPLSTAVSEGRKDYVELLLEKGAKVDAVGKDGWQPLHLAAKNGHKAVLELILTKGVRADAASKDGKLALHLAAQNGHKEVVELLLAKGADIKTADKDGWQAVHWAAHFGQKEVIDLLLKHGANVNAATNVGSQPLHLAAQKGHKEVVKFLLEKGAVVNASNKNGQAPLHLAMMNGHIQVEELLVSLGAKS